MLGDALGGALRLVRGQGNAGSVVEEDVDEAAPGFEKGGADQLADLVAVVVDRDAGGGLGGVVTAVGEHQGAGVGTLAHLSGELAEVDLDGC